MEELQAKHSDQWLLLNKCWVFSLSSFMLKMSHLLAYPKQKANFKVYTLLFLALLLTGFILVLTRMFIIQDVSGAVLAHLAAGMFAAELFLLRNLHKIYFLSSVLP